MSDPRPVMQTELGPLGNCQSACLATLLGCDLAEVPNFNHGGPKHEYGQRMNAWLLLRGLQVLTFVNWQGAPFPPPVGYFMVGGVSPRGNMHAVIYKDGELWHDPHPEGGGIVEPLDMDFILPAGSYDEARFGNLYEGGASRCATSEPDGSSASSRSADDDTATSRITPSGAAPPTSA